VNFQDASTTVRSGEELDAARLEEYLKTHLPGAEGPLLIEQFPSGFSNLTYLLRLGERELVLRRPPFGSKVKSAHDMGREYRVLSALHGYYPAPKPLLLCDDPEVIGAQFYVMERIPGVILRKKKPEGFAMSPDEVRACCQSFVRQLADLHAINYQDVGLAALRKEGSYVERQVSGWIKRYYGSQTDDIPMIEETAHWLEANYPQDVDAVIVHNDYKFDNLILDPQDPTRIIGVLDWEMCTIGDPLMDLGTAMGYWTEQEDSAMGIVQCFLTTEPGSLNRRELAEQYGAITGRDVSNIQFYYVFSLLKLAVIVQQIYYRYKQGLTTDERFAQLIYMVGALGHKAVETIETGKI
jgi:aminoglycoside phosphotransferase (APT) family kinase protein